MRAPSRSLGDLLAPLLFAFAVTLGHHLELGAAAPGKPEHSLYLPSGRTLKPASLGFRGALADALYVWSIQYYSTERADRWRGLVNLYDVITDLDPRFEVAYLIGALILSMEASRPDQALALLEKGIRLNPGRYLLPWEAAFYAREVHDAGRAGELFDLASRCPDAPSYVRRHYLDLLERLGKSDEALALWREAWRSARTDYERSIAERHIQSVLIDVELHRLRRAIADFRGREGRWPRGLEELVRARDLDALRLDPAGRPYLYDPASGEVRAQSSFLESHRVNR